MKISDRKRNAIKHVKEKKKNKLRGAVKELKRYVEEEELSKEECEEIIDAFAEWMHAEMTTLAEDGTDFVRVAKAFYNWVEKVNMSSKNLKAKFANTVINLIRADWVLNSVKRNMIKRLVKRGISTFIVIGQRKKLEHTATKALFSSAR